eukprot:ANDGO_05644.mRNA.1 hypothetical protein
MAERSVRVFDICGYFTGRYEGHGIELVHVHEDGEKYIGTKVIGDLNVPSGCVSFEVPYRLVITDPSPMAEAAGLAAHGFPGVAIALSDGHGYIAERFHRNPARIPGSIVVHSSNSFTFTWSALGSIFFSRVQDYPLQPVSTAHCS